MSYGDAQGVWRSWGHGNRYGQCGVLLWVKCPKAFWDIGTSAHGYRWCRRGTLETVEISQVKIQMQKQFSTARKDGRVRRWACWPPGHGNGMKWLWCAGSVCHLLLLRAHNGRRETRKCDIAHEKKRLSWLPSVWLRRRTKPRSLVGSSFKMMVGVRVLFGINFNRQPGGYCCLISHLKKKTRKRHWSVGVNKKQNKTKWDETKQNID